MLHTPNMLKKLFQAMNLPQTPDNYEQIAKARLAFDVVQNKITSEERCYLLVMIGCITQRIHEHLHAHIVAATGVKAESVIAAIEAIKNSKPVKNEKLSKYFDTLEAAINHKLKPILHASGVNINEKEHQPQQTTN